MLNPARTAVLSTFRYGVFRKRTTGCGADATLGGWVLKHIGGTVLAGFYSGGENFGDGAWALSFAVCKRRSIRDAAARLHGAARGLSVQRCAATPSSPLLSNAIALPPALALLYDNCRTLPLFPPVSILQSLSLSTPKTTEFKYSRRFMSRYEDPL